MSKSINKYSVENQALSSTSSINKSSKKRLPSKNDITSYFNNLLNNKKVKKYLPIVIGIIIMGLFVYYLYNLFNNKCPTDCKKYINGDININGKICKVPVINGVKCPTNCVYETVDKYVKYNDCNCDLDTPMKTPKILVESQGNNVKKCPANIYCNDCKLMLKLSDDISMNPIKSDFILNFEPINKSIYLTRFFFKLHAYSNNNSETLESPLKGATVQIQFLSNVDNKSILLQQIINLSNDEQNKEIIFNINMNQPVLINSGSIVRLIFSNPNKDDIYIDYLSSLNIEYKHILETNNIVNK
jgi:hypothetical protein